MDHIFDLLAVLRAAQVSHQHAHWTAKGDCFYGDHLLFGQLYEAITDEFDTLAEKAVHLYGVDAVDPCKQLAAMLDCVKSWERTKGLVPRAILVERSIQAAVKHSRDELLSDKKCPLGLDNFLAQLADNHDKAAYLLGRRNE